MRNILLRLFSHRTLANLRWDLHLIRLRATGVFVGREASARHATSGTLTPRYLNLGSGPRGIRSDHWINVDAFPDRNVDFLLDFTRPLPFPDSSFDGVFCEHVLEHFSFEDGIRTMSDVCRILKPGGTFRIIVPNAQWILRCYIESPETLVKHRGIENQTAMETVNDYFRQRYEHHFLHDFESLSKQLSLAGFPRVIESSFSQSLLCPELALDHPKYAIESLYVEAVKG